MLPSKCRSEYFASENSKAFAAAKKKNREGIILKTHDAWCDWLPLRKTLAVACVVLRIVLPPVEGVVLLFFSVVNLNFMVVSGLLLLFIVFIILRNIMFYSHHEVR